MKKLEFHVRPDISRLLTDISKLLAEEGIRSYLVGGMIRDIISERDASDIDIAVEDLHDPLAGLRALDDASELTSFPVDIVELDRIDRRHAETILSEGKVVYELH